MIKSPFCFWFVEKVSIISNVQILLDSNRKKNDEK